MREYWHNRQDVGIGAIVARLLQGNQCLYDWVWEPFHRRESVIGILNLTKSTWVRNHVIENNLLFYLENIYLEIFRKICYFLNGHTVKVPFKYLYLYSQVLTALSCSQTGFFLQCLKC